MSVTILQKVHEAIRDYERLYLLPPNTIYVADATYAEFLADIETQLNVVWVAQKEHAEETLYGLRIKISKTIKDGFCVVNELS